MNWHHQVRIALLLLLVALVSRELNADSPAAVDDLELNIIVAENHKPTDKAPPLLVHFHGASKTVDENFRRSELSGVLASVNCRGLSSAYRRPFENRQLFSDLLTKVKRRLVAKHNLDSDAAWGRVDLSCFSAGYGAVREILKQEKYVARIDAVVAADSIYASIKYDGGRRVVNSGQMQPFLDYAVRAKTGRKSLLIFHSQLPVKEYASTFETADYLIEKTNTPKRQLSTSSKPFALRSIAAEGGFLAAGFAGDDGEAHLEHLRSISLAWRCLHTHRQIDDVSKRRDATLAILKGSALAPDSEQ